MAGYILMPPEKIEKSERWMSHYGPMGVFVARLLPGARQLVGIPAGVARMDYLKFSIYTLLGAATWCSVLCYVGVKAGQDEQLMHGEMRHVALWLGGAALVLGGLYYFFVHRHMARKVRRRKSEGRIKSCLWTFRRRSVKGGAEPFLVERPDHRHGLHLAVDGGDQSQNPKHQHRNP